MRKLISFLALATFIVVLSSSITPAQGKYGVVGKKFTVVEATTLFGKVIGSIKVKDVTLRNAVEEADEYVFITIKHNKAYVLNEKKAMRLMVDEKFTEDDPLYYFSKSVVEGFLNSISSDDVSVERRAKVLTVSGGAYVLEMALMCPPICLD